ncbi:MAG: Eco57I restriction-modification methylase domain-containing protein [Pirellulaceae bacterium]
MYQWQRWELIQHLYRKEGKSLDAAIRIAQKLLDRIIFIAFCEDRELLPENLLRDTEQDVRMYSRARNPQWESFLDLFTAIDKGAKGKREISAFNGGLFADDPEINSLELVADKWTNGFVGFGKYDFSEEVSVEVLGHLFERSITELEKLRVGGLIALEANIEGVPDSPAKTGKGKGKKGKLPRKTSEDELTSSKMTKSAERKRFGIYYTPPPFTGLIVERTVDALAKDRFAALARAHKVDPEARRDADKKRLLAYWTACLEALKSITVCDPACGSGAFLIRAYESLDAHYKTVIHGLAGAGMAPDKVTELEDSIPDEILSRNLFGVDLSQEAVEITQLALWIRSARKGKTLTDLSQNIIWGNSLVADEETVRLNYGRPDSKKQPKAMGWETVFPSIFASPRTGFDCVIGNPPWEQLMLYEREFFGLTAPNIASALNTADRGRLIAKLERDNPELFKLYETAKQDAERMQDYVQSCGHFPLTAKGRANTFALFAELACGIVNPHGRVGLLVPSGIATDTSTKEFFAGLMENNRLVGLYDFENRRHIFPDVDPRFKFCVLLFGGSEVKSTIADFVFFAHRMEDLQENYRHIDLSWKELSLFNPNSKTCPIFRSQRDAALTKSIYRRVPILIDKSRRKGGNPWGLRFRQGLFNQSSDSGLFKSREALNAEGFSLSGNRWTKHDDSFLALYEAKMVQAYDHRAASVVIDRSNWVRQGQTEETTLVYHQNPEFEVQPRYWVLESEVLQAAEGNRRWGFVVFKDITSATNTRTMIAAAIPWSAVPHPLPLVLTSQSLRLEMCLLANFNSIIYDFVSRQKVGGTHLTFFIVEQIPTLPPTTYSEKCPWAKRETLEHWISERVLKLSCTAEDMIPLAQACDFKGSRGDGVHLWKEEERAQLRAELDAAYFHLYGISREDAEYILSTFTNTGLVPADERPTQQLLWSPGSPGERILEAYDRQEK